MNLQLIDLQPTDLQTFTDLQPTDATQSLSHLLHPMTLQSAVIQSALQLSAIISKTTKKNFFSV